MPREREESNEIEMRAVKVAPWDTEEGRRTYSVIGLGEDGAVYRYDASSCGWVKYSMHVIDRVTTNRSGRHR